MLKVSSCTNFVGSCAFYVSSNLQISYIEVYSFNIEVTLGYNRYDLQTPKSISKGLMLSLYNKGGIVSIDTSGIPPYTDYFMTSPLTPVIKSQNVQHMVNMLIDENFFFSIYPFSYTYYTNGFFNISLRKLVNSRILSYQTIYTNFSKIKNIKSLKIIFFYLDSFYLKQTLRLLLLY